MKRDSPLLEAIKHSPSSLDSVGVEPLSAMGMVEAIFGQLK